MKGDIDVFSQRMKHFQVIRRNDGYAEKVDPRKQFANTLLMKRLLKPVYNKLANTCFVRDLRFHPYLCFYPQKFLPVIFDPTVFLSIPFLDHFWSVNLVLVE